MNLIKILSTPYPRPRLQDYYKVALAIGGSIAFILCVFQPFNTDRWQHPYKFLLLAGYGLITALTLIVFYTISLKVNSKKTFWTIGRETLDVFLATLISLLLCNIYRLLIFDYAFSLSGLFHFLAIAGSVAFMPVVTYLFFLFRLHKDLTRSEILSPPEERIRETITLRGQNKNERIETKVDDLLFVKSEDNYLILHILQEGAIQSFIIRSTIKQLLEQLDPTVFLKCHRSYLINIHRIKHLSGNKNNTKIHLVGAEKTIPVSRSLVDQFRQRFSITG